MRIAETYADVQAIFACLAGRHDVGKSERATAWFLAPLFGIGLPTFVTLAIVREGRNADIWSTLLLGGLALSGPFLAAQVLANAFAVFDVTLDSFRKISQVPGFSWSVNAGDVHSVTLELTQGVWVMVIASHEGKKPRVALLGTIRARFSQLYPEFAESPPSALPRWVAMVTASVTALVVLLLVVGIWYVNSLP